MRNFNAKTGCDSRVYEYLLPTYTLMAKKPIDPVLLENAADQKLIELPPATAEELAERRAYRASEEQLKEVANILSAFEGTNNFHNYTIGRHYKDKASTRYIMSFKVYMCATLHLCFPPRWVICPLQTRIVADSTLLFGRLTNHNMLTIWSG